MILQTFGLCLAIMVAIVASYELGFAQIIRGTTAAGQ
jgi:hypothetical protein